MVTITKQEKLDALAGRIFAGVEGYVQRAIRPVSEDTELLKARINELEQRIAALEGEKKDATVLRIA